MEKIKYLITKDELRFLDSKKSSGEILFELLFSKSTNDLFLDKLLNMVLEEIKYTPQLDFDKSLEIKLNETQCLELIQLSSFKVGFEFINVSYIENIVMQIITVFKENLISSNKTLEEFLFQKSEKIKCVSRVFFNLVENKNDVDFPFAFMATYAIVQNNNLKHVALKYAFDEFKDDAQGLIKLLSNVEKVGRESEFIKHILDSSEIYHPIKMTNIEALTFLKELELYERNNIKCRIPNWWKTKTKTGLTLTTKNEQGFFSTQMIINYELEVMLNNVKLSRSALEKLLDQDQGLVFVKGNWIEVDHKKINELLKIYDDNVEQLTKPKTLIESLNLESSENVDVVQSDFIVKSFEKLADTVNSKNIKLAKNFNATLRDYQSKGVNWLYALNDAKFGCCLADDMGLGKTIQVIALLTKLKEEKKIKNGLIILPVTLIANWEHEILKFAPELKYKILHNISNDKINDELEENIIFLTTYTMVAKRDAFMNHQFDVLIIDEAQAIKNPNTNQTKAIKKINASFKLAMTGTPIENNLFDLWSLYDFINPGLLGSYSQFSKYTKDVSSEKLKKIKLLISPFLLRRLKTDKSIIDDLPDKIEKKQYINLSKKQIVDYKKAVDLLEESLQDNEKTKQTNVLTTLLKTKQICNHPDLVTITNLYKPSDSGKFIRLEEICNTIKLKQQKVLVFTQFQEMCEPLHDFLEQVFGRPGLILNGKTKIKDRKVIVDKINNDLDIDFLVITVKAGGVGLNLTGVNNVVHFDRWWNPAIEKQATDRVFRIGQKQVVTVHTFVCENTIEEQIDKMLESKKDLADRLIEDTSNSWIGNLSNQEITEIFKFRG